MVIAFAAAMLPFVVAMTMIICFDRMFSGILLVCGIIATGCLIVYYRDDELISTPVWGRVYTLNEWLGLTVISYPIVNIVFLSLLFRKKK